MILSDTQKQIANSKDVFIKAAEGIHLKRKQENQSHYEKKDMKVTKKKDSENPQKQSNDNEIKGKKRKTEKKTKSKRSNKPKKSNKKSKNVKKSKEENHLKEDLKEKDEKIVKSENDEANNAEENAKDSLSKLYYN